MTYEYKCSECGKIEEIEKSMKEDIPSTINCSCGKTCYRVFGASLYVPDYMKATDSANGTYAEFNNLKSKFAHAKRPSGKDKIYY